MNKEREAFESAMFKLADGQTKNKINPENGKYMYGVMEVMWKVWQAAKAQAVPEGYILIPKKMPDEVNDHLWDFMTDNFVCTNDYGDSFMACDDFNLDKFYAELVKAQEPSQTPQFNLEEFLIMEEKLKSKGGVIVADLDRFIAYAEMVLEKAKALKEPK